MSTELLYIWKEAVPKAFRHPRRGTVKSLILHSTDGREAGDVPTLMGKDSHLVSVHWYITRTGKIYHFVQNGDEAFHAGTVINPRFSNANSIGIEHEHFDGSEDWPDVQIEASALLYAFLRQEYPNIEVTHHSLAASPQGRKRDPVAWPSDRFWKAVSEVSLPVVARPVA